MAQSLANQFLSNQNKGIVWKLMGDNDMFNDISPTKSGLVKAEFDKQFIALGAKITSADQLINLNKRVISEMVAVMPTFRAQEDRPLPVYNSEAIAQQRQSHFQNELKSKQADFEQFNNKPAPATIDFSDKMDTPIGAEMDKILAEQIAMREKDLNQVLQVQDKTAASKWIQNDQAAALGPAPALAPAPAPAPLKIGEQVDIKDNIIITPKKVNFTMPTSASGAGQASVAGQASASAADSADNSMNDFMALLKKKPAEATSAPTLDRVKELLNEISQKQTDIINILNKL